MMKQDIRKAYDETKDLDSEAFIYRKQRGTAYSSTYLIQNINLKKRMRSTIEGAEYITSHVVFSHELPKNRALTNLDDTYFRDSEERRDGHQNYNGLRGRAYKELATRYT